MTYFDEKFWAELDDDLGENKVRFIRYVDFLRYRVAMWLYLNKGK